MAHSKAINKMFVYNHKQSEWRELAAMKTARAMFGTVIHQGKIIAVGGVNEEGLNSMCETYDFATNKWVHPVKTCGERLRAPSPTCCRSDKGNKEIVGVVGRLKTMEVPPLQQLDVSVGVGRCKKWLKKMAILFDFSLTNVCIG